MLWIIPIAAVLLLESLWRQFVGLFATGGGWSALAERFAADAEPAGASSRWQSIVVSGVNYNNCATIVVTEDALYLALPILLRIVHPPLLIPWSQLHRMRETRVLQRRFVVADVGDPVITTLSLPLEAINEKPGEPLLVG